MAISDQEVIRIIVEKMSTMKHRVNKGYGASQPYRVKSSRASLGQPGIQTDSKKIKKDDIGPVKVSRAFSKK